MCDRKLIETQERNVNGWMADSFIKGGNNFNYAIITTAKFVICKINKYSTERKSTNDKKAQRGHRQQRSAKTDIQQQIKLIPLAHVLNLISYIHVIQYKVSCTLYSSSNTKIWCCRHSVTDNVQTALWSVLLLRPCYVSINLYTYLTNFLFLSLPICSSVCVCFHIF